MLVYVASSASAREAWDSLKDLLEAQGGALGIVLVRQKLFQAQCERQQLRNTSGPLGGTA